MIRGDSLNKILGNQDPRDVGSNPTISPGIIKI